ncbi:MAG: bifunctional hydroxymethylpyrimidine kinase/phosphomethylpyrimidine kinase [Burkholderiaceae bacterium]|jgi:hydroxymethylpyrimidine kinase/phosphomethylpyrimidine kinase/thiamine-phosphate diphosphorylase|nr:bifunctional hydroxymethylpyrimidine kinase/phosphomethylpyrimidine kinase [Burkholderiaceae bacterium]
MNVTSKPASMDFLSFPCRRELRGNDEGKVIVWSIAGNDSAGGAGLSADARAAAAFGVHLCPVAAAVTAQNSRAVTQVQPVTPDLLDAQLAALADDMPPAAVKTGLLGGAANIAVVARWIDRLRERGPVALVVDPVLGASTGAAFADAAALRAYRDLLLPRATLVTPNVREARALAGEAAAPDDVPALARQLKASGAQSVAVTGGDEPLAPGWSLDWITTPHASGWLALPRVATPHTHGTGCTFATSAAAALALGYPPADVLALAKMATTHALHGGYAAGQGAGPVAAQAGFAARPDLLPFMSWDENFNSDSCLSRKNMGKRPISSSEIGLYAIVDSAERVRQAVAAGARTVQLRIKTPAAPDAAWPALLRQSIAQALAACNAAGAALIVNDHWRLALEAGASTVHLGQEDLLALGQAGRAELAASGLRLGISSHSLWELCRARALRPWYVACGPVWPTLTKDMPWLPQGLDNLAWWARMAGVPVAAIGGILEPDQLTQAARTGASGVCVVRGLGADPAQTLPRWQAALAEGRAAPPLPAPELPHPVLAG